MSDQFPYKIQHKLQIVKQINALAALKVPFIFIIDYKAERGFVMKKDELDENFVQFEIQNKIPINETGSMPQIVEKAVICSKHETLLWNILPLSLDKYLPKFNYVQEQIHKGNSFLTNLTQPTEIQSNLSLFDIYNLSEAKYKLWLKEKFVVFSPEIFVRIQGQTISSFPMKGTIDAGIENAEEIILNDPKEKAEHATIVDLIRNDLSLVAEEVVVKRYRYVEKLTTNKKSLLQVSSEISGQLPLGFHNKLGDILFALLPAGSICGAPKTKTLEIIEEAEGYDRGFYSGIFGFFDGKNLDSAVMIRFVEQDGEKLIFKSGGGITAQSDLKNEYEELIQKVYVPIS